MLHIPREGPWWNVSSQSANRYIRFAWNLLWALGLCNVATRPPISPAHRLGGSNVSISPPCSPLNTKVKSAAFNLSVWTLLASEGLLKIIGVFVMPQIWVMGGGDISLRTRRNSYLLSLIFSVSEWCLNCFHHFKRAINEPQKADFGSSSNFAYYSPPWMGG